MLEGVRSFKAGHLFFHDFDGRKGMRAAHFPRRVLTSLRVDADNTK